MLGALLEVGLDPDWLRALPARLALDGVEVRIQRVLRAGIACTKVDFDIPPQPHGRHIKKIREMVAAAGRARCSARARGCGVHLDCRGRRRDPRCGSGESTSARGGSGRCDSRCSGLRVGAHIARRRPGVLRPHCRGRRHRESGARNSSGARAGNAQASRGARHSPGAGGCGRARYADRGCAGARAVEWTGARIVHSAAQRLRGGDEGIRESRQRPSDHAGGTGDACGGGRRVARAARNGRR